MTWRPLSITFCLMMFFLRFAIGDEPAHESGGVLLVNKPDLYSAPSHDAQAKAQPWEAGLRLTILERREIDSPTSPGQTVWLKVQCEDSQGWLPDVFAGDAPLQVEPGSVLPIGREAVDRLHALPPEYQPDDLVAVGPPHEKDREYTLRKEAAAQLRAMLNAADLAGIELYVVSAFRPWSYQQELYQSSLARRGWAQDTVARPGHSEHQLGTAVDLTDGDAEHLLRESFGETEAGRWLRGHAWQFGFAQSFTRHNQPQTGFAPEPWHYRYWGLGQARAKHCEALGEAAKKVERNVNE